MCEQTSALYEQTVQNASRKQAECGRGIFVISCLTTKPLVCRIVTELVRGGGNCISGDTEPMARRRFGGRSRPVKRASPTIGGLRPCRAYKPNFERRPAAQSGRMMRLPKQTQSAGCAARVTEPGMRNKANREDRPGASTSARMQNKANVRRRTGGRDGPIRRNKANRDGGRHQLTAAGKGGYESRGGRRACEKQSQFALPDRRRA